LEVPASLVDEKGEDGKSDHPVSILPIVPMNSNLSLWLCPDIGGGAGHIFYTLYHWDRKRRTHATPGTGRSHIKRLFDLALRESGESGRWKHSESRQIWDDRSLVSLCKGCSKVMGSYLLRMSSDLMKMPLIRPGSREPVSLNEMHWRQLDRGRISRT
jgi:hypothetical protein